MSEFPNVFDSNVRPLIWVGELDGHLSLLEQKELPQAERWLKLESATAVADAIREMSVRGAPAIGIAAAYGVALGFREDPTLLNEAAKVEALFELLAKTRPTAVNLFWALDRMRTTLRAVEGQSHQDVVSRLLAEAHAINDEDHANNQEINRQNTTLLKNNIQILTHYNTNNLTTNKYNTTLNIIHTTKTIGKLQHI